MSIWIELQCLWLVCCRTDVVVIVPHLLQIGITRPTCYELGSKLPICVNLDQTSVFVVGVLSYQMTSYQLALNWDHQTKNLLCMNWEQRYQFVSIWIRQSLFMVWCGCCHTNVIRGDGNPGFTVVRSYSRIIGRDYSYCPKVAALGAKLGVDFV